MKEYIKFVDGLPLIVKIILALPVFDGIVFGIYRIFKGYNKSDGTMVIVGILWIILGIAVIGAIIDIISLLLYKKVVFFA